MSYIRRGFGSVCCVRRPARTHPSRVNPEDDTDSDFRILIVEDHASLREALILALERTPGFRVVGEAGTLAEGLSLVGVSCDVAIVDLGLPDGSGITLVSSLIKSRRRGRVLILTASLDE